MSLVEVRDLVRRRGDVLAVDHLSLTVEAGEIFGLLGPNGAGKTSTIEVLEGLEMPDAGSVSVFGIDVRSGASDIKQRIGVQLQSTGLPRYLTVFETIDLFASFYGSRAQPVQPLLDRMGIAHLARRKNAKLSGGERQRVALALALVNDPDILFLDEPSTGLDPQARRELWTIIRQWRREGKTVFLTTHDMHEAETLCDEIAIMDAGRVVVQGTLHDLIGEQKDEQVVWVQANGVALPSNLELLVPSVVRAISEQDGALLYTDDAPATIRRLLDLQKTGSANFENVQVRPTSLEDVFLRHTGHMLET
jgi:ABC-2 type transport system ATP-binding protein